jgi:hypothetical protein
MRVVIDRADPADLSGNLRIDGRALRRLLPPAAAARRQRGD